MMVRVLAQYQDSVFIRGDNVLAGALSRGALDARTLYPDVPTPVIREEAKKFYDNPVVLDYDLSAF